MLNKWKYLLFSSLCTITEIRNQNRMERNILTISLLEWFIKYHFFQIDIYTFLRVAWRRKKYFDIIIGRKQEPFLQTFLIPRHIFIGHLRNVTWQFICYLLPFYITLYNIFDKLICWLEAFDIAIWFIIFFPLTYFWKKWNSRQKENVLQCGSSAGCFDLSHGLSNKVFPFKFLKSFHFRSDKTILSEFSRI